MKKAYVHLHLNFQDAQVFSISRSNKVQAEKNIIQNYELIVYLQLII